MSLNCETPMLNRFRTCLLAVLLGILGAQPVESVDLTSMELEATPTRNWFFNPDGSCVQCSIGMAGTHCNDPKAATLLWDTPYGPAIRGGSTPARVAAYCNERGIKAWNITGESNTFAWMTWAAKTGRFAAIGAGRAHFQTLYGRDFKRQRWLVCNNQTPSRIDEYDDDAFRRLHMSSGPWIVVLAKPSSANPQLVEWWK